MTNKTTTAAATVITADMCPVMKQGEKKFSLKYRVEGTFEVGGKSVFATFEVDATSMDEARATVSDLVNLNAAVS